MKSKRASPRVAKFEGNRASGPVSEAMASDNFIELTADIVSAYVSNNTVAAGDIPGLINQVHGALLRVSCFSCT